MNVLSGNTGVTCKAPLGIHNINKFRASKFFLASGANVQVAVTVT